MMPRMKTRFLIRSLLSRFLAPLGYEISGNHIFSAADFDAICAGAFRPAVLENPESHPNEVVRAAELLSKTYT